MPALSCPVRGERRRWFLSASLPAVIAWSGAVPTLATAPTPREQVFTAERAFARTIATRDLAAFSVFVSEEAVFCTGPTPLRGRAAVAAGWARFFAEPQAPFSWAPDEVEVLASAVLAPAEAPK